MNTKKMNYKHFIFVLFLVLVCINFIHIEFIGMVIYATTNKIIATQQASEFIQTIGAIPYFSYTQTIVLVNIFFFLFVALMFIESLDVFAVHLVDEVGAAVVNRLGPDAAGAQVSEKLMYER